MKKRIVEIFGAISLALTIITGGYAIYKDLIESKEPSLNLSTDGIEHATRLSSVNGLQANYYFNGRKVNDLWIIDLSLINDGDITLVGVGARKNIVSDLIKLRTDSLHTLIKVDVIKAGFEGFDYSVYNDGVSMKFIQWRPKEYVKMRLFLEGNNSNELPPILSISDRQILDGKISYYGARYEKEGKKYVKDLFSFGFSNGLRVIAIMTAFMILVGGPITLVSSFVGEYRLNKWYKDYYDSYQKEVEVLVQNKVLPNFIRPRELPSGFWAMLSVPAPITFPPEQTPSILSFTLLFIMAAIGTLLWLLPVFW